jgi:hypothetical protein
VITSVQLNFYEVAYANSDGLVSVLGYARNGNIASADGAAPATLVGSFDSIGLGQGMQSVLLNAGADSLVQSLLGNTDDLGIPLTAGSANTNSVFAAVEQSAAYPPPTVQVTYSVPEPATAGLLGFLFLSARPTRPRNFRGRESLTEPHSQARH